MFFRSETLLDSFNYLNQMIFDMSLPNNEIDGIIYVLVLLILDFFMRKNERIEIYYFKYDWLFFSILIILILEKFGNYKEFIYYQF